MTIRGQEIREEQWRLSMSGYSIKTGWSDEKVIIVGWPAVVSQDVSYKDIIGMWTDKAITICDAHNTEVGRLRAELAAVKAERETVRNERDAAMRERERAPSGGWCIELKGSSPCSCWDGRGPRTFSIRSIDWLRFARKEDAECARGWLLDMDRQKETYVAEHVWLDASMRGTEGGE